MSVVFRVINQSGPREFQLDLHDFAPLSRLLEKVHLEKAGRFDQLQQLSRELTHNFLGESVCRELSRSPKGTFLEVETDLEGHRIPYEALWIGDGFLGTRFAVGRVLPSRKKVKQELRRNAAILVADAPELVNKGSEVFAVQGLLRQIATSTKDRLKPPVTVPVGLNNATFWEHFQTADWLHLIGHTQKIDNVRCLKLNSNEFVSPDQLLQLPLTSQEFGVPQLVFLAVCAGLQIPRNAAGQESELLVEAMLKCGVAWLIGATQPFEDSDCREIVTTFYEAILAGKSPGQSLMLARRNALESFTASSVTALNFVLYGSPVEKPF